MVVSLLVLFLFFFIGLLSGFEVLKIKTESFSDKNDFNSFRKIINLISRKNHLISHSLSLPIPLPRSFNLKLLPTKGSDCFLATKVNLVYKQV